MLEQALNNLPTNDRKLLMIAFEQEIAQYVELANGLFIGVNVAPLKNLEILEQVGSWAYGKIRRL